MTDTTTTAPANTLPCVFCGGKVESSVKTTDFCRNCHYTGRNEERRLDERGVLGKVAEIDNVRDVGVWHTGGGCFVFAITLDDGRLLTASDGFRESGEIFVEPTIPAADEKWALVVSADAEAWGEWNEEKIEMIQALLSDDELAAAVATIARGGKVEETKDGIPVEVVEETLPDSSRVRCSFVLPRAEGNDPFLVEAL